MFRTSRPNVVVVPLIALVAVLALAWNRAEAQNKPFKIKGEGNAPEGLSLIRNDFNPYSMAGTATHLGNYSGFGVAGVTGFDEVSTDPFAVLTGSFSGWFVFVAKNGDRLICEHPGTFAVYSDGEGALFAVFDAIFSPTSIIIDDATYSSTGRFENVGGSFRMIAITKSFTIDMSVGATTPFDLKWQGAGSLNFPK